LTVQYARILGMTGALEEEQANGNANSNHADGMDTEE
jgi:hypothetical protein